MMVGGMLRISMPPQVNFSLESFFTEATPEGFVARMFSHVSYEVAALRE